MIPSFLLEQEKPINIGNSKAKRLSFVDKTTKRMASFVSTSMLHWQLSQQNGLFQKIDARAKVIFLLSFVILVNLVQKINIQIVISCIVLLLFVLSRNKILKTYKRILIVGFLFGFVVFIPASLNIFTKGTAFLTLISFKTPLHWWIYTIPQDISITYEGIYLVFRLCLKVINSVSVTLLVINTTTFEHVIKALSYFKVPDIFLLTLTMSYKFIFLLAQTTEETYRALKMRWWNRGPVHDADEIVTGRIGYLFLKSWERYETVYQSMIARGFSGNVNLSYFEKLRFTDYIFLLTLTIVLTLLIILNNYV